MTESEDLYQIALLIDQLKHDDVQLRLNASKCLIDIARALGVERTRNELIPFLNETTEDEDEVLIVVAEKLGELCDYVGGDDFVHLLLSPLEMLVAGEESSVRCEGIKSLEQVVSRMNEQSAINYFFPTLKKLASRDWFTARGSAVSLLHLAYNKVSNESLLQEIKLLFLKLCADDTPFVRRAAAQNIVNMIKMSHTSEILMDFVDAFKAFARDDQDSIRIQVVPIAIALLRSVSTDVQINHVLPVVLQIANDRSWRVRWSLANHLHEILQGMDKGASGAALAGVMEGLLNDTEPEVRAASAVHLSVVCNHLQKSVVISKILPTAVRLVSDSSEFVRAFFATEINFLSPLLGRDLTVQHILPLLLVLLRDEISEVRLNVISSLDAINSIIGVDLLSQSLLPAIVDLAQDHKWRVRLAIIDHIPMLGKQLGVSFFNEKLVSLCMSWLSDDVFSIRKAAAENLQKLSDLFGCEWCKEQIIPKVQKMYNHTSFSQRLTSLYAVQVLLSSLTGEIIESVIMPLISAMAADPVPNIRFTVAKTLEVAIPLLRAKDASCAEASSVLLKLSADSDRDVRYYADKALSSLQLNVKK